MSTAFVSFESSPPFRSLEFPRRAGRKLRVNVFSETSFFGLENQGGHTAFIDCAHLMAAHPDLEVRVNSHARCDVFHSHSWGPLYFAQGARHWSPRRVYTAHVVPETAEGTLPFMELARPLTRAWTRWTCDYADRVLAVAPMEAEVLRELGVRAPILTVPNPIRGEQFRASRTLRAEGRQLLGLAARRPVVLGVGQIQPRKGIADFAEVARAVPEADFVWVGGRPFGIVSAGIGEMNRLMASPPANLRFAGMVDHERMPAVYNAADILLFPSFQENCPYAPMEAASCGLPVVFRDLPEYRALYPSRWLATANAGEMARAVRRLLASRAEYASWTAASHALAEAFSVTAYVDAVASVYDELACEALDGASDTGRRHVPAREPAIRLAL